MGFLQPLALLALPLALLPLLLEQWTRRGAPQVFSSLHLFEVAGRRPAPPRARSRTGRILRMLAIALLVLAAARPVGPGRGGPAEHRPTALVVAVDVSGSVHQREAGLAAWTTIRAVADSILALATEEDEIALAAIADGVVGWWTGPPAVLRRRLAGLEPTARASDWPEALQQLEAHLEDGTEAYLLTDGAVGARSPRPRMDLPKGWRALRVWQGPAGGNRTLVSARWTAAERVGLAAEGWGQGGTAVVGRRAGSAVVDSATLPLDGEFGAATWVVGDSATFTLVGSDRLSDDDRLFVARGSAPAYRVDRLTVPGEPPESGVLFWEAALAAAPRGAVVGRVRGLEELTRRPPALALLPIRAYRADEGAAMRALVERGTRLLFVPVCPQPACLPAGDWLPEASLAIPSLRWRLDDPDRRTLLAGAPDLESAIELPGGLLERAPVRGALETSGGAGPDWTWKLVTGEPALWVRGRVAIWLVPLGPPVTRLATTPLFPLVADAVMAAWDDRWRGGGSLRPGDGAPVRPSGETVVGPLQLPDPTTWKVGPGDSPPRLERPGLYRVTAGDTTFVAVNGDPAEGNLTPVPPELWAAGWGARPTPPESWQGKLFPRRRGPELWPWAVVLALAGLVVEARLRHAGPDK